MVTLARAAVLALSLALCGAGDAAARAPLSDDLINLRDLGDYRGGLSLAPDGSKIAFFERETRLASDDYRYHLMLMPSDGGAPQVIADAGDIVLFGNKWGYVGTPSDRAPAWSPDSEALAYLVAENGKVQLAIRRLDGDETASIIESAGDVRRFAWLDAGHLVVETAPPREVLAETARSQGRYGYHMSETQAPYYSLRPEPQLTTAVTDTVVAVGSSEVRNASAAEISLLDQQPQPDFTAGAVARDQSANAVAWIAPVTPHDHASTPRLGLNIAGLDGSAPHRCAADACTLDMQSVWIIGREVVFRRMEGSNDGITALYAWDPSTNAVRLIRRADEVLLGCVRGGSGLICLQETPTQPRRIVSIDRASGAIHPVYDPNPQWRTFALPRVERIEVKDAYGNDAFAHLVFPAHYAAGRRYPVVVVQYRSRGFQRGGTGGEYPIFPLAARGYFVLSVDRPEWRGARAQLSNDDLQRQTELDNSENEMKQSAIEAMLKVLDQRGLSDTRRIGITGLSNGAESTFWAIMQSDLFAAAVVSNPPNDATAVLLGAPAFVQSLSANEEQGPFADPASPWGQWWARNNAILHAEAIHTPLLMNLPESEAMMGFPLATRLTELHRPVDVYVYPGAFHVKWAPQQILAAQNRAMDWIDFWLRGVEHEDARDPDRLERWRALRQRVQ